MEEDLTMRSIASANTDHGISTMNIDNLLDREDCLYSIGQFDHIMLLDVCVSEDLTVEQVWISDMKQTIANNSE